MKKITFKILAFVVLAVTLAMTSCGKSPEEQLADVIAQTNTEIGGKEISAGCICDSVVYGNGNMVYYFTFPGIDLGQGVTDEQFISLVKPSIDTLLQGNLGSDDKGADVAKLTELLLESNSGVEFKMNFAGRNLNLSYSPEEIKTLLNQ